MHINDLIQKEVNLTAEIQDKYLTIIKKFLIGKKLNMKDISQLDSEIVRTMSPHFVEGLRLGVRFLNGEKNG